jgi:cardiolipin synthase
MPRPSSLALVFVSLNLAACGSHSSDTPDSHPDASTTVSPDAGGGDDASVTQDAGSAPDGGYPRLLIEPDQGMTPVYDLLTSAKSTIDATLYELDDTMATQILTQAAKNGVKVRIILDQNLEMSTNQTAYTALSALANVEMHWASPTYDSTHQKTITVDQTTSAVMTLNFESDDYATSRDFAVLTQDPVNVAAIEKVFAADLQNASITPPTGDGLVWSPTNSLPSLLGVIEGAKSTLLVENEEMGDLQIVAALSTAAQRGVDVKVVMEQSRSYQSEFESLQGTGVKVNVYSHSQKLYIHAKVILADYGTSSASVFIGSENFSSASLTENRELGVITSDAAIMAGINTTLTSDFNGGTTFHPLDGGAYGGPDAGSPSDAGTPPVDAGEDAGADDAGATEDAAASG